MKQKVEFNLNDIVFHSIYGIGQIIGFRDKEIIIVEFPDGVKRYILKRYPTLRKINDDGEVI